MKILKCYPFGLVCPLVLLVEGFKKYVGILGDEPGDSHKGIDYARKEGEDFISFEVFSAHDGNVFQGKSDSWGNFVKVYKWIKNFRFETVYAHLDKIPESFPILPEKVKKEKGFAIREGRFLGWAGTSGTTKGKIQLHFELWIKNLKSGERKRVDPYGVNGIMKEYYQPGQSLSGLEHFWISDNPPFANEV